MDLSLSRQISKAKLEEQEAQTLAGELKILADWLRRDILAVAGPCYTDRQTLYDFVVAELQQRLNDAGDNGKRLGKIATIYSPSLANDQRPETATQKRWILSQAGWNEHEVPQVFTGAKS